MTSIQRELSLINGANATPIKNQLQKVLDHNEGYLFLRGVADMMNGHIESFPVFEKHTVEELSHFKFAPITPCDVERLFSQYKSIYSDRRRRLATDTIKQLLAIKVNSSREKRGSSENAQVTNSTLTSSQS